MTFQLFIPQGALDASPIPVLYFLSGLTCNEDNFMQKSGVQEHLSKSNVVLCAPDTSQREHRYPGDDDSYDFGLAAGFYLDATAEPWSKSYRMYSYIVEELPLAVSAALGKAIGAQSIFGHSMGGHGAIVIGLRNPEQFRSVSAFAPICNPKECPWGKKAFSNYLKSEDEWDAYDSSELASRYAGEEKEILVDQGVADQFLAQNQLLPEALQKACEKNGKLKLNLRKHENYDHSYYFIQSFIENHVAFHMRHLNKK